jgi:hypothetical protein
LRENLPREGGSTYAGRRQQTEQQNWRLPTAGGEDVRVDPKTADADDREAEARARAADSHQRGV